MSDEHDRNVTGKSPKVPRDHILTRQTRGGWLDEIIHRAETDGQFRNLPGEGKPLPKADPYESLDEWALAHHILKQSGFLPPWIELRKEIDAARPAVVAALEEFRRQRVALDLHDPARSDALRRVAGCYVTLAREINEKIDEYNVLRPSAIPELVRFREDAIERG